MKPVLFACLAMVFYAFQNVLIEQKLSRYSTVAILVFFYASLFPAALAAFFALKASGQQVAVPSGAMMWATVGIGTLYFFGDYFYIGAYTRGGNLFTVATIVALFPALASVMKYLWTGVLPNRYHVIGYVFAFAAVAFVAKGNLTAGK